MLGGYSLVVFADGDGLRRLQEAFGAVGEFLDVHAHCPSGRGDRFRPPLNRRRPGPSSPRMWYSALRWVKVPGKENVPMRVEHIYRYPVKGLTAEALEEVLLSPGECLPHDRRFALAQGDSPFDPA